MSSSLFSPSWYRVARLRPSIRSHARFHRHRYRGQLWYVLQDHSSGRSHRLTPSAYHLAGLMNGERTAQEIWEAACTQLGDEGPTQDETIRLLGLLHAADVLRCDIAPDCAEILRRSQRRESSEWWRRYLNPLSIRIPLVDPDAFLARWTPWVRHLFSWGAAAAWFLLVGIAVVFAAASWEEISAGCAEHLLDARSDLLLLLVYPVVKLLHELGHAFAARVWGGEVHEMGILFLVLVPIPYVDASSASVFPEKWRRIVVASAGVMVELLLAAGALFVWLNVESGWVRLVAYDVMWIGGASTLLFNGNPLLRFDGYYVLADAVEIPNLAGRSRQYIAYLLLRYLFGIEKVRYPVTARGEEAWFVFYGLASFVYRIAILLAIALFVAGKFFVVGVLLAGLVLGANVVAPLVRHTAFLLGSSRFAEQRTRAILTTALIALAVAVLLLVVPIPLMTRADGVVWPPEGAQARAGADGFVLRVLAEPGADVKVGDLLVQTRDPSLEARVAVLEAELRELRARHHAERRIDLVRAQITLDEIAAAEARLARARERVGDVVIRSPADGSFLMSSAAADLVGRFLKQGELVGYVVGPYVATARVVVPQSDIALVRQHTERVDLRLSSRVGQRLETAIRRHVPAATDRLPSRALGTAGGGPIPVDPQDPDGLRTLEKVFQLDVALPRSAATRQIGARVHVRFCHGSEPLGFRMYRALRRLFLRRLGV
jgi:putative peptide zinc metalloprotease protein